MSNPVEPDLPWLSLLPPDDVRQFREELAAAVRDGAEPAAVAQLIIEWQHTAEVYADPDLLAVLRQEADDRGRVSKPSAG
jgi:hypothetical protein